MKPFAAMRMRQSGPAFNYPVSLLHLDGANGSTTITDERGKAWARQGNGQISTAQSKFGGASLLLDGAGDWIETASSLADIRFGTGDFTLECWVRTTQTSTRVIFDHYTTGVANTWGVAMNSSGNLYLYSNDGGGVVTTLTSSGEVINTGAWVSIAVCRKAGTLRLFVNGTIRGSVADPRNYNGVSSKLAIGAQVNSRNASFDWSGHIDEVRICKGFGLYDANYTPATSEFPDELPS